LEPDSTQSVSKEDGVRLNLAARLIIVAIFAYVGVYISLSDPETFIPCLLNSHFQLQLRAPRYRIGGAAAELVFAPLSWLDRKIRPNYWASQRPLPGMTVEEANAATARDQRGGFGGSQPSNGL
jgi:hypothetical protein